MYRPPVARFGPYVMPCKCHDATGNRYLVEDLEVHRPREYLGSVASTYLPMNIVDVGETG